MSIGIKQRAAAYLQSARQVREIDAKDEPEAQRLQQITDVLLELAKKPELFPTHAFPRAPGTPGGLFRLAEFADGKGAIYVSLGYTGRKQSTPHRHASWAIVAGISGGVESNVLYDFIKDESRENGARVRKRAQFDVGPGDAVSIETGAYHTIEVISDTPVLHLHAYGYAVDKAGFTLPTFKSPEADSYTTRETGTGFHPPPSAVAYEDIQADVVNGHVAVVVLDGAADGLNGKHVYRGVAALREARPPLDTPIVLVGADAGAIHGAARQLYDSGRPLVFQYRAAAQSSSAAA